MTVPKEDRNDVARAWIAAGEVNIADVMQAVRDYIAEGAASIGWVLDLEPLNLHSSLPAHLTAEEMTIGELADVADEAGVGWDRVDPIKDARHAVAILTAVVANRTPLTADKARERVRAVTAAQMESAYRIQEQRPADPS